MQPRFTPPAGLPPAPGAPPGRPMFQPPPQFVPPGALPPPHGMMMPGVPMGMHPGMMPMPGHGMHMMHPGQPMMPPQYAFQPQQQIPQIPQAFQPPRPAQSVIVGESRNPVSCRQGLYTMRSCRVIPCNVSKQSFLITQCFQALPLPALRCPLLLLRSR